MSITELRRDLKAKKAIFGTDKTIKELKKGNLSRVYLARNCKESARRDIEHYCKLGKVKLVNLKEANDELGAICKKPFIISVISFLK
jgi:large subunit ribosomal protein L30e